MKWRTTVVLISIALGFIGTPSLPVLSESGTMMAIGSLDVCHPAEPSLFSDDDMPCTNEGMFQQFSLAPTGDVEIVPSLLPQASFFFPDEHPPEIA